MMSLILMMKLMVFVELHVHCECLDLHDFAGIPNEFFDVDLSHRFAAKMSEDKSLHNDYFDSAQMERLQSAFFVPEILTQMMQYSGGSVLEIATSLSSEIMRETLNRNLLRDKEKYLLATAYMSSRGIDGFIEHAPTAQLIQYDLEEFGRTLRAINALNLKFGSAVVSCEVLQTLGDEDERDLFIFLMNALTSDSVVVLHACHRSAMTGEFLDLAASALNRIATPVSWSNFLESGATLNQSLQRTSLLVWSNSNELILEDQLSPTFAETPDCWKDGLSPAVCCRSTKSSECFDDHFNEAYCCGSRYGDPVTVGLQGVVGFARGPKVSKNCVDTIPAYLPPRVASSGEAWAIRKRIVATYISRELPCRLWRSQMSWIKTHPDFEHVYFDDDAQEIFMKRKCIVPGAYEAWLRYRYP
jgi:hypothetical protein